MAKHKGKHVYIPSPSKSDSKLPPNVALTPNKAELELSPYQISFEYYNYKLCEVNELERNKAIQCIENMKTIGKSNRRNLNNNGIDYIRVNNSGEYSKLFNGLTDDVDLREHKISGTSRLFYFTQQSKFCIVAITNAHFETDKHR